MASTLKGPKVSALQFAGGSALEVTITYRRHHEPVTAVRRVRATPLPSLPLDVGTPHPASRIELVDSDGMIRYRRAFIRPGRIEVLGRVPGWAPFPLGHAQILVALVPDLAVARIVAFAPGLGRWLNHAFD